MFGSLDRILNQFVKTQNKLNKFIDTQKFEIEVSEVLMENMKEDNRIKQSEIGRATTALTYINKIVGE